MVIVFVEFQCSLLVAEYARTYLAVSVAVSTLPTIFLMSSYHIYDNLIIRTVIPIPAIFVDL